QGGQKSSAPGNLISGIHSRGVLPHLRREGASYFVTFRLADTLPADVMVRLKREREAILQHALVAKRPLTWHEQEELFRWHASRVDAHLDAGHGRCWLRRPDLAQLVSDALRFFDGVHYDLPAWVVLPNHVHVVARPYPNWPLSVILKSWKGY